MIAFHWNDRFLTGLYDVDTQHLELVQLINRFGDALAAEVGAGDADVALLVAELINYARFHFAEEEGLMARVGVDRRHVERHKRLHAGFVAALTEKGDGPPNDKTLLMKLLVRWLGNHILGTDQLMGRQIAAIQAGAAPDAAYRLAEESAHDDDRMAEPLVDALNDLYSEVASRNRELLALNQSLEAKVRERTAALVKANQQLEAMAMSDLLTGLPNRRHAMSAIERFWEDSGKSQRPMACMLIDADGFKQINDTFGHDAGDEVLRQLAATLRRAARTDDVVCRLGGDEFLVLMPSTDLDGALLFGERVRMAVDLLRVPAGTGEWKGSISVAVAVRVDGMVNPEALIKVADEGVYVAKRKGRNCVATVQSRRSFAPTTLAVGAPGEEGHASNVAS